MQFWEIWEHQMAPLQLLRLLNMYCQLLDSILYALTCLYISTKRWLASWRQVQCINYNIQFVKYLPDNPTIKSGTARFSITTKSLDYSIGTFQVASQDTISSLIFNRFKTWYYRRWKWRIWKRFIYFNVKNDF